MKKIIDCPTNNVVEFGHIAIAAPGVFTASKVATKILMSRKSSVMVRGSIVLDGVRYYWSTLYYFRKNGEV